VQEMATAVDDDDHDDFRHEVEVSHGWLVRGIDLSGKVLEPLTVLCRSIVVLCGTNYRQNLTNTSPEKTGDLRGISPVISIVR